MQRSNRISVMQQVGAMLQMQSGQRVRNFETKTPAKQCRADVVRILLISAAQRKRELRNATRRENDVRCRSRNSIYKPVKVFVSSAH